MGISVIIPVYNTKHEYLSECLDSLIRQDFQDLEVIVVNDGSKNGCDRIIDDYAGKYDFIKAIHQENKGTSVARNAGLDAAKGRYVMFVDGDDYVSEGCLRAVYDEMEKRKCDILFFGYSTSYTNREIRRVLSHIDPDLWKADTLEMAVLRGDKRLGAVEIGAPWGKLIRRSVIEENAVRYTPGIIKGQDTVFVLTLLDYCKSFSYLPFPGYHYRISGSSVSRRFNPKIVSIMEKTLSAYMDFVEKRGKGSGFKEAVRKKYIKVLLGEYLELLYLNPDNRMSLNERMKEYKALLKREPYRDILRETETKDTGFLLRTEINCLKSGRVLPVFLIKKAEMCLRSVVIKRYG